MSTNPFINALTAAGYIGDVALVITFASMVFPTDPNPPISIVLFLSLFVLSAAVMGYIFLATPLQMFLDGKKREATAYFFKTVLAFACVIILLSLAAYFIPGLRSGA